MKSERDGARRTGHAEPRKDFSTYFENAAGFE